jgi:hypothetical protein
MTERERERERERLVRASGKSQFQDGFGVKSQKAAMKPIRDGFADALVPHTWRVKNVNDIVTRVPAVLGYAHVGCSATVCPDGGIMLATGSGDDLQDSIAVEDIVGRITSGYPWKYTDLKNMRMTLSETMNMISIVHIVHRFSDKLRVCFPQRLTHRNGSRRTGLTCMH